MFLLLLVRLDRFLGIGFGTSSNSLEVFDVVLSMSVSILIFPLPL